MKLFHRITIYAAILTAMLSFSSCGTRRLNYDFRDLAAAAIRLDMDIDLKDNHKLYLEAPTGLALRTDTEVQQRKVWTVRG